jgi:hypothetical protein
MKKFFLNLTVFFFATNVMATEVLVTSPEPTTKERLAEITEHYRSVIKEGDFVSSYEYFLNHPASQSQMAVILDLDSQGRADSLNGNFKKAEVFYSKLLSKLQELPNVVGLEKITLATRINLAHMAVMLKHRDAEALWKEAHAWDPNAKLSPEEFSPAVILRFEKPSQIVKKSTVELHVSNDVTVFVDGQKIKASESDNKRLIRLEAGHHQVAAISPGTPWTIKAFEVRENSKKLVLHLKTNLLVGGNCDSPQLLIPPPSREIKILVHFDDNCARVYSEKKWFDLEGKVVTLSKPATFNGVKLSDDLKPGGELSAPDGTLVTSKPKPGLASILLHSPWFWTGVGAVIIGAIVISRNQTTTEPTHTVSN